VVDERRAGIRGTTQGCGTVNAGSHSLDSSTVLGDAIGGSGGAGLSDDWESIASDEFLGWRSTPRPGPVARQEVRPAVTWALESAPNPRVIRVHTTVELTRATIEKCPPASPPEGLSSLLAVDGVRFVDLHRYRARLNLSPRCNAEAAWDGVARAIEAAWGAPAPLRGEPQPRAFEVAYEGPRIVAESPEMAAPDVTLVALFRVPGVAEAILEAGRVWVRPGLLFSWEDVETSVRWTLQST
jgi:hypothetical protein